MNTVQQRNRQETVERTVAGKPYKNSEENRAKDLLPDESPLFVQNVLNAFHRVPEKELAGLTFTDLSNESLSLKIRRKLAWQLAKGSKPEDWAAIKAYLSADTDIRVKAVMVEALGHSTNPQARDWLISALDCGDPRIIRSALRGMADMDDPRNAEIFLSKLSSEASSADIRAAAAAALGKLSAVEGGQYLMQAWEASPPSDKALRAILLEGLSHRNLAETEQLFGRIMSESSDPELRRAVVQAVSQADGETAPFLLDCLNDADNTVRAEAAWGLALQQDGKCAGKLMDYLKAEQDESVKGQLYEALAMQSDMDAKAILVLAQTEMNDQVRLSAYNAVIEQFDNLSAADQVQGAQELFTELKWLAVNGSSLNVRLRAVAGLRKIRTAGTENILQEIVAESRDPRVIKATGVDLNRFLK